MSRKARGNFVQTRSMRINLANFSLTTKNKRILRKNINIKLNKENLPLRENYHWTIHQMGSSFYRDKFGDRTMSASKIKSMFTSERENPNIFFKYALGENTVGYSLGLETEKIIHYAYPFYKVELAKEHHLGMGMIIHAILYAQQNNKAFFYLGTLVDPKSIYKLQFRNIEWFDEKTLSWSTDLDEVKKRISLN